MLAFHFDPGIKRNPKYQHYKWKYNCKGAHIGFYVVGSLIKEGQKPSWVQAKSLLQKTSQNARRGSTKAP